MTTLKFIQTVNKMNVENKLATLKKIEADLPNRKPNEIATAKALIGWVGMSIMVGEDLCPPTLEHLSTYITK